MPYGLYSSDGGLRVTVVDEDESPYGIYSTDGSLRVTQDVGRGLYAPNGAIRVAYEDSAGAYTSTGALNGNLDTMNSIFYPITLGTGGQWWRANKHVLDGVAPMAMLSPASGRSMLNGKAVNDNALVSRQGGIKYVVGADGVLTAVPGNTLAYDWSNRVRELLFEGQSTNYMINGNMTGAVVGVLDSGGVRPADHTFSTYPGITVEITAVGETNGVPWVEYHMYGTNSSGAKVFPDPSFTTRPAAVAGETWTYSFYAELVAGLFEGTSGRIGIAELSSSGAYLSGVQATKIAEWKRYSLTRTLTNASTAFTRGYIDLSIINGATVDCTFRLGAVQLEKASAPTSYIPTSGAAVTRPADVAPLWSDAGDATAWAWRGGVPTRSSFQQILSATGGPYLESGGGDPTILRYVGYNPPMDGDAVLPATIGSCFGWGDSGSTACNAGKAVRQAASTASKARTAMSIGPLTGLITGQVLRLHELVAWQLPDRPSAAGCQSQARLWSA